MGHVDAPWRGPLRAAAGNSCEGAVLGGPPCHPTDACPPPAAGVAGGLTNLSKMPACNIMLLGAQRKTLSGFSSTSVLPHTGYIYHSDIVQSLPPVSAPWVPGSLLAAGVGSQRAGRTGGCKEARAMGWPGVPSVPPTCRARSPSSEPRSPRLYVGELDLVRLQTGEKVERDTSGDHWLPWRISAGP